MSYDIEKALAYQIKKEIAERYFRLRKLIEDDSANAKVLLEELNNIYQERLQPLFLTIYALLSDEDLIKEFSALLGLKAPPFLADFLHLSQDERLTLIKEIEPRGWFRDSKFQNLLLDAYKRLYKEWQPYHDLREEVLDELEIVKQEINQFKKNYSLDEIMQFLRTLNIEDESTSKAIGRVMEGRKIGEFEQKLGFSQDIDDLFERLPELDSIPEPKLIDERLKELGQRAYIRHKEELADIL